MPKFFKLLIPVVAVCSVVYIYYLHDARTVHSIFPGCLFHAITGFYCPGCGSQRTLSSLLHGDLKEALQFNLIAVVFLPLLLYAAYVFVYNVFSKKEMRPAIFYSAAFTKSLLIIIIAFWILRNIPSYPFNLLAPHS